MRVDELRYHQAVLELTRWSLDYVPSRAEAFKAAEERRGMSFGASVREWYLIADSGDFRKRYSIPHAQEELQYLGELHEDDEFNFENDPDLVQFMIENQGVGGWSFKGNSGDDPEVFWQCDFGEEWEPMNMRFAEFQWQHTVDYLAYFEFSYAEMLGPHERVGDVLELLGDFDPVEFPDSLVTRRFKRGDWLGEYVEIWSVPYGPVEATHFPSSNERSEQAMLRVMSADEDGRAKLVGMFTQVGFTEKD